MVMGRAKRSRPTDLVSASARDFLNTGLRVLFADGATAQDANLGVVSTQTTIDLLLKYRLIAEGGWFGSNVRGREPTRDLAAAASS